MANRGMILLRGIALGVIGLPIKPHLISSRLSELALLPRLTLQVALYVRERSRCRSYGGKQEMAKQKLSIDNPLFSVGVLNIPVRLPNNGQMQHRRPQPTRAVITFT